MNTTKPVKMSVQDHNKPGNQGARQPTSPEKILQRLDWQVIRRLDGLLQGDYRSLFYGYGVDFADLREYQPEDDIRYIDWNVTARMDSPFIRQYMEDREITAWFLLDLSPSMDYGSTSVEKRSLVIDLVATLSRLLTRHGNKIGAILFNGQESSMNGNGNHEVSHRLVPARGGRNQSLILIHEILKQPKLSKTPLTNLDEMITNALLTIKKRALIFVISDYISSPGWERNLNMLSRRNEVIAIRIVDPREMELPDAGPIWLEDAETGQQIFVDTSDRKFRSQFFRIIQQREQDLSHAFRYAGVEPWTLSTDEDLVQAILRFSAIRKQYSRTRRGLRVGSTTAPPDR